MGELYHSFQALRARIAKAARDAGRNPGEVQILAVSKTWPAERLRELASLGQLRFGENQVQEAIPKIGSLIDLPLEWHFVGPIQSNKTRPVAEHFSWVHSVDREKIAQRLNDARPSELPPLNVCLQVNISGEKQKGGVPPHEAASLAGFIAAQPRLKLRGLMTIPEMTSDFSAARSQFRALRELKDELAFGGFALDTLSMGMSHDFEAAIMEGATIVRIGTAIFGERRK